MTDSLGLSVGVANLVAARADRRPVSRRAVVTLFDDRACEVGVAEQHPNAAAPGLTVRGFVQRVGDPVGIVAADGSTHLGEQLLAEALDALATTVGYGAPVAVAVPAHWGSEPVAALGAALADKPSLSPVGRPPPLVSDAAAAIAALYARPGLPTAGVIALCDFGASGSSVTLVDASSNFAPVTATVRYDGFSGDQVDADIVDHVLVTGGGTEPARTAAVGSLTRLRDECQRAKERLSTRSTTAIPVRLPGFADNVTLTRTELERIIAAPLAGFVAAVAETLTRNGLSPTDLSAVATVGGGANTPLIGARLSERLLAPVVTDARPAETAAVGAELLAAQGPPAADATAQASAPTGIRPAAESPTSLAPAPWAAGMADRANSESFPQLAWSQEEPGAAEPAPYSGDDYDSGYDAGAEAGIGDGLVGAGGDDEPAPLAWYKQPAVLFGLAAALALTATGGLVYTLTSQDSSVHQHLRLPGKHDDKNDAPETAPEPTVITVTAPNGATSLSTITPPPTTTETTETTETAETTEMTETTETTSSEPPTTATTEPTTTKHPTTTNEKPTSSAKPAPTTSQPPTTNPEPTTAKTHTQPSTAEKRPEPATSAAPPEPGNTTWQRNDAQPTEHVEPPDPDDG